MPMKDTTSTTAVVQEGGEAGEESAVTGIIFRINDGSEGPELLREVLLEKGWTEYERQTHGEHGWNVWWRTSTFRSSDYDRLLPWQRLNHHANTTLLTRKDSLARCLQRMRTVFGAHIYNFCPLTYNLPADYSRFVTEYTYARRDLSKANLWICKPSDLSRGRGIILFNDIADLQYHRKAVVQQYITNPLLIGGYKFDLRLYAVCPSLQPLTIYIYQEGLVRFATEQYDLSSLDNQFSHLTNTSINKHGPSYAADKAYVGVGCKWTVTQLRQYFHQNEVDDRKLWSDIIGIVVMTLIMQALQADAPTANCFELYGFDIIIDENLKPWLLEVNYSPSLASDCQRDVTVKKPLLHDVLDLAHFTDSDRQAALGLLQPGDLDIIGGNAAGGQHSANFSVARTPAYLGLGMRTLTTTQINLGSYSSSSASSTPPVHRRQLQLQHQQATGEESDDASGAPRMQGSARKLTRSICNLSTPSAALFRTETVPEKLSTASFTTNTDDCSQNNTNNSSMLKSEPQELGLAVSSRPRTTKKDALINASNIIKARQPVDVNNNSRSGNASLLRTSSGSSLSASISKVLPNSPQIIRKSQMLAPTSNRRPQTQKNVLRTSASYQTMAKAKDAAQSSPHLTRHRSFSNFSGLDTSGVGRGVGEGGGSGEKGRTRGMRLRDRVGDLMLVFPFNETTRSSHANGTLDLHRTMRELPAIHHIRQQWHAMADRRFLPAIARLWCPPRPHNT